MFKRLTDYFRNVLAAALNRPQNRYEAGVTWGTSRSYLPGYVEDARYDLPAPVRSEIIRKSRYFERNSGLVNRLLDLFEQYTVGSNGIQFIPASSNEPWNAAAREYWEESCKFMDLTSLQSYGSLNSLSARTWFVDGETFLLKTRGQTPVETLGGRLAYRPRIQLIETQRLQTPDATRNDFIDDGIEVDANGRTIRYYIRTGYKDDTVTPFPASMVIPISEPPRPGMIHAPPFLYPVLNDLHDLDDLQVLEMKAAKEAAEITNVLTNAAGEANPAQLRRERFSQATQTSTGGETTEQRTQWFKNAMGGRGLVLKTGEDYKQFMSNRPTVASQQYWDFLTSKICAGVGISKLLVYPWSMQGTVTRADLDVMAGFFRSRFEVLAAAWFEVYLYFLDFGIKYDPRLAGAPVDWRKVNFYPPRSVNVDVGRNSNAVLAELAAGLSTYEAEYAKLGLDAPTQLRKKGREAALIRQIAEEEGVTPGEIANMAGEQILAAEPAPPTQQAA